MATDEETIRRRYREFLELTPLAIAIAGLPDSQSPYNYSADQMEIAHPRAFDRLQAGAADGARRRDGAG